MQEKKSYSLENSPLYGLKSRKKLHELLKLKNGTLEKLRYLDNYHTFIENGREINSPKPLIKKIQKSLFNLLSRIETPNYLHSGKKGRSYVTNASCHLGATQMVSLDLRKFYTNCKREFMFKFLFYEFKMAEDIAWLLVDIFSFENHLPTGSSTSQLMAFFSYKKTFDRINRLAEVNNVQFSLYVDDMCFSSKKNIPRKFVTEIARELEKVDLYLNNKKTKNLGQDYYKEVTGCMISPNGEKMSVPNRKRFKIICLWRELIKNEDKNIKNVKSLRGLIQAARQIEPRIFQEKYDYLIALEKKLSAI